MAESPHRKAFAAAFHRAMRIPRSNLYSGVDDQMPLHLQEDARIPQLGFVGKYYQTGGTVILAINPGGGGDAYKERIASDNIHLPAIERFVESESVIIEFFEEMNTSCNDAALTWRLWNILGPVIDACGGVVQQYTFMNCFPFRTREDKSPRASALRAAWSRCIQPTLEILVPSRIIALGKGNYKAGWALSEMYVGSAEKVTIERTNGDRSIAPSAYEELSRLRQRRKSKGTPLQIFQMGS